MSNVIAFPKRHELQRRERRDAREASAIFSNDATIISTILIEGIDNPARALEKAADAVNAMPRGAARDLAERELETLKAAFVR